MKRFIAVYDIDYKVICKKSLAAIRTPIMTPCNCRFFKFLKLLNKEYSILFANDILRKFQDSEGFCRHSNYMQNNNDFSS